MSKAIFPHLCVQRGDIVTSNIILNIVKPIFFTLYETLHEISSNVKKLTPKL